MFTQRFDRTRISDSRVDTERLYTTTVNGGATSFDGPYSVSTTGRFRKMMDQKHQNYLLRKRAGDIILGDLSILSSVRSQNPAHLSYDIPEYGCSQRMDGDLAYNGENEAGYLNPLLRLEESEREYAIMKVLVSAYNVAYRPGVMGGEFLADVGKSIQMLKKPFASAQKLIKDIANAKHSPVRRERLIRTDVISNRVASAWLERQHGWIPICQDILGIVEQTTKKVAKHRERIVARSGERVHFVSEARAFGMTLTSAYKADVVAKLDYSASFQGGVIYELVNSSKADELMANFGFRSSDLPTTAWEIIPLSWVVDYFVGIGDWLQVISPDPRTQVLGNWVTEVINSLKETTLGDVAFRTPSGVLKNAGPGGSSVIEDQLVNRYTNLLPPDFPMVRHSITPLHSVNLAALTTVKISNMLRSFRR